jgi:hypothetical protein
MTGKARLRPALDITLLDEAGAKLGTTRGLVDSGADFTTLPAEWAELLEIDLNGDCSRQNATVADGSPSLRYVYTGGLNIEVANERLFLDVVHFCMDPPFAYLGRHDFFDRHLVLVDQREFRIFLEQHPEPDEDDRDDDPQPGLEAALL